MIGAVNRAVEKRFDDSIASKECPINEADEICREARRKKSALRALRFHAGMSGLDSPRIAREKL